MRPVDLTTRYMGLTLANPFIVGAGPLTQDPASARQLEQAGAAALVLPSLFEELLTNDPHFVHASPREITPAEYLTLFRSIRSAVDIPVIASLNGSTLGGWVDYARQIEQAGAQGIELNVYDVPTDLRESSADIEQRLLLVVRAIRHAVKIPLAVKLPPFFTSIANVCAGLDDLGVDALILFTRFYEPDIDLSLLDPVPCIHLSDPGELRLRLRWLAILSPQLRASLVGNGGVYTAEDALKAISAGASAVQVVSCLLKHGPDRLRTLISDTKAWLSSNGFEALSLLQGQMSLNRRPANPAYERANYRRVLQSWPKTRR